MFVYSRPCWYPGIDSDIERYVRSCEACIVTGKSISPSPGPLHPLPLPSGPWRRISVDIAGEFVAAPQHQRFLIVAVDHYSKWPEVTAVGTVTTSTVIKFLSTLFEHYGLIEECITDNGVQFTSAEFRDFLSSLNIRHCLCANYAPQSNSAVERFNRVFKEGISAAMADGKFFSTGLRQTVASYRMIMHSTTGESPAALVFAFHVRTPLSVLKPPSAAQPETITRVRAFYEIFHKSAN
jgi:transposase InsO family protein